MFRRIAIMAMAGAALAVAACSEDAPEPGAAITNAQGPGGAPTSALDPSSVAYFQQTVGDRVFFETDGSSLTAQGRQVMASQAAWLTQNPGVNGVIEGHADERGTREYNLALGARRAEAARNYLVSQGISSGRLRTVSYGKERPEALCSAESCWSENRRAVTVIAGAPVS